MPKASENKKKSTKSPIKKPKVRSLCISSYE